LKLKEAYQITLKYLRGIYDANEAKAISRLVFEYLGFNHLDIFTSSNQELNSSKLTELGKIQEELALKKPVQYVLGYSWFYQRKFQVSPACLIPRQETEGLVDIILKENRKFKTILDIGTGSGCIAISLKLGREEAWVTAMEISTDALTIARENASLFKTNIHFVEDDILDPDYENYPYDFDLIVSNPPYVRESEKDFMSDNVLSYEPGSALFVEDDDPLLFYRAIREFCRKKLVLHGFIFLEVNEALALETAALFNNVEGYETLVLNELCSKSEKCEHDIRQKLENYPIDETDREWIIAQLLNDKFLDNERYTGSFVRDKFHFNKWGKLKIKQVLYHKNISESVIKKALDEINSEEYYQLATELIDAKNKSLKDTNIFSRKVRLFRFAAQKGFEPEVIYQILNEILEKK